MLLRTECSAEELIKSLCPTRDEEGQGETAVFYGEGNRAGIEWRRIKLYELYERECVRFGSMFHHMITSVGCVLSTTLLPKLTPKFFDVQLDLTSFSYQG